LFKFFKRIYFLFFCSHRSTRQQKELCFTFEICNKCDTKLFYYSEHKFNEKNKKCGEVIICQVCGGSKLLSHHWKYINNIRHCILCGLKQIKCDDVINFWEDIN